jgi:hypothetical protein
MQIKNPQLPGLYDSHNVTPGRTPQGAFISLLAAAQGLPVPVS